MPGLAIDIARASVFDAAIKEYITFLTARGNFSSDVLLPSISPPSVSRFALIIYISERFAAAGRAAGATTRHLLFRETLDEL